MECVPFFGGSFRVPQDSDSVDEGEGRPALAERTGPVEGGTKGLPGWLPTACALQMRDAPAGKLALYSPPQLCSAGYSVSRK